MTEAHQDLPGSTGWLRAIASARLLLSLLLSGCADDSSRVLPSANLPSSALASCGSEAISSQAVVALARATHRAPSDAANVLIGDACLAAGAKSRGLAGKPHLLAAERSANGRLLLEAIKESPTVRAPVTDADLARIRRERWWELDHGPAHKVLHAVAKFPASGPRDPDAARDLASKMYLVVREATNPADFRQRALAAVNNAPSVKVEELEPVLKDGRVLGPEGASYDTAFAEAAHRLARPGDVGAPSESSFGFHVIFLLEIIPPRQFDDARLRELVGPEVRTNRARADVEQLLVGLRKASPPSIERDVDDLLARPVFRAASTATP